MFTHTQLLLPRILWNGWLVLVVNVFIDTEIKDFVHYYA